MVRTKTNIRNMKSKGASFEYDCQASLGVIYKDVFRTSERGFQMQYDLRSNNEYMVFECKRLKGISWNQCMKYFKKLEDVAPAHFDCYLLFKSNRQPCLVMYREDETMTIEEFGDCFGTPFIKHKSTRVKKGLILNSRVLK